MSRIRSRLARLHAAVADAFHLPLRSRRVDPFHEVFPEFIGLVEGMAEPVVLELGSRNVTGVTRRHLFPTAGRYIGCDIHPGEGVDLVADIHRLSDVVEPASVDAVFSVSVFEHLVYPWKAVLEINRVLKPGGYVFTATHPSWPAHELPWDFWRFPVGGLAHLMVADTGFELVRAVEGVPAKIYSLAEDAPTRGLRDFHVNLGVAVIGRKVGDYDPQKLRWDIDVAEVVKSEYPRPT
jgi:SAM-dependent methyltransferase